MCLGVLRELSVESLRRIGLSKPDKWLDVVLQAEDVVLITLLA